MLPIGRHWEGQDGKSECRRVEVWTQGFQKYTTLGVCGGYFQRYGPIPFTHLQGNLLAVNYLVQALALELFRHFLTNERLESWQDQ